MSITLRKEIWQHGNGGLSHSGFSIEWGSEIEFETRKYKINFKPKFISYFWINSGSGSILKESYGLLFYPYIKVITGKPKFDDTYYVYTKLSHDDNLYPIRLSYYNKLQLLINKLVTPENYLNREDFSFK